MATLISANGGGNWTAPATWRNACAGAGAIQTTPSNNTSTGVNYAWSVSFTVTNGEVIEGLALLLKRQGSVGTITVALSEDGGATPTREVTVNASDIPDQYSWVFFKFDAPLTADGGSDYKVAAKNSNGGSGASLYRSSTAADWNRILRENSAPGALSAGDAFFVMDDVTGAGTKDINTVTMDCLASAITDFGEINVGFGTLSYGVAAATNYYLKLSGDLNVWGGGYFTKGTTGATMPADSTAILEFDCTTDGEFGLNYKEGAFAAGQGNPMARVWELLNANAAANATSLTTVVSTGWRDNDQIVIASTTRTPGETESGALNGNASGTTLTVDGFGGTGGGVAYAHDGSATGGPGNTDIRAEIINLTRNVKIRSSSSAIMTYIYVAPTATVDFDYVEIYYVGENATGKRGVEIATTTGSCSIQYCSLHDCEDWGLYLVSASGSNIAFSNNVCFNLNTVKTANLRGVLVTATTGVTSMTDNVFLAVQAGNQSHAIYLGDNGMTFSNNRVAGGAIGSASCAVIYGEVDGRLGTCTGNVSHSTDGYGWGIAVDIAYGGNAAIDSLYIWRTNGSYGFYTANACISPILLTNAVVVGAGQNSSLLGYGSLTIQNSKIDSDPLYPTNYAILMSTTGGTIRFENCALGGAAVFAVAGIQSGQGTMFLYNTTIANAVECAGQGNMKYGSFIHSHKNDASATTYKTWYKYGTVLSDQTTRHTASGYAWRLMPTSAIYKMIFPGPTAFDSFKAAVAANATVTITAWVCKDSNYNGNAPRLVLVGGYISGIAADVTSALSVGANEWEQLSVSGTPTEAGVIEWYIDCDGTAGSVYVDDMAVSQSGLPSADNLDYVSWGLPLASPYTLGAAAAGGLMTHPGMAGGMRG